MSICFSVHLSAASAVLSNPIITDVTDRSFSLIWTTDAAGELLVEVYSDLAANQLLSNIYIDDYGVKVGGAIFSNESEILRKISLVNAAQEKGIAKVVVSGLLPDTTYYVKYGVKESQSHDVTLCPGAGSTYCPDNPVDIISVSTESKVTRVSGQDEVFMNDILLHLDPDSEQGEIVLVNVENANYPVSAIVGDAIAIPYAYVDLNNYYKVNTRESLLLRSKDVTIRGNPSNAINIVRYKGLAGVSNQLAVLDQASGTGGIANALNRNIGDCNADGHTDGYDSLLLTNYVADVFNQHTDEDLSFHKYLCDLYADNGLAYTGASILIDNADVSLHNDLLVGKKSLDTLPVLP